MSCLASGVMCKQLNDFHLEVDVVHGEIQWILDQLDLDHQGIYLLHRINERLNALTQSLDNQYLGTKSRLIAAQ